MAFESSYSFFVLNVMMWPACRLQERLRFLHVRSCFETPWHQAAKPGHVVTVLAYFPMCPDCGNKRTGYSQGDVLTAYYPNLILTPTLVNHGLLSTAGHVGTLRCFHRVFLLGGLACGLLRMLILDSSSTSHISAIAKHAKSLPSELVEHCFRIEA